MLLKLTKMTLIGLALMITASCRQPEPVYYEQFLGFGTLIEVKIWGVNEAQGRQAVEELKKDFSYMHETWHAWKPSSVGRTNQLLETGETFTMAPSVLPLVARSQIYELSSKGLFNPAIGQVIREWGFASDDLPKGPPPDREVLQKILDQQPSVSAIKIDGILASCSNPAVKLDFGGFAKGLAVDRAIEHLKQMGIQNAIVNAGGDLRGIGRHGNRAWRVGIRNPRGEGVLASVDVMGDESIFTSGDYERYYEYEGRRYHHIIDPRDGMPARGVTSVTVFDTQADRADAAATALFVAGPEQWFDIAKSMGVSGVALVTEEGKIHMTPNLKDRIYFDVTPKPEIIFSDPL